MARAFKVNLNDESSDNLRLIAKQLNTSETEVLRKGLSLISLYSQVKSKNGEFIIKQDGNEKTLEIL